MSSPLEAVEGPPRPSVNQGLSTRLDVSAQLEPCAAGEKQQNHKQDIVQGGLESHGYFFFQVEFNRSAFK